MNEIWSGILSGIGLAFVLLIVNIFYNFYQRIKLIVFIRDRLIFYCDNISADNAGHGKFHHLSALKGLVRELNVIVESRGKSLKEVELCGLLNCIRYIEAYLEDKAVFIELNGLAYEKYKEMFLSIEKAEGTKFLNFTIEPTNISSIIPTINGNMFINSRQK